MYVIGKVSLCKKSKVRLVILNLIFSSRTTKIITPVLGQTKWSCQLFSAENIISII